jgi:hypothetical protein
MVYSLLRDVNSHTQDWRVRVRIERFWEHVNVAKNNELLRLQFVMVDEKVYLNFVLGLVLALCGCNRI